MAMRMGRHGADAAAELPATLAKAPLASEIKLILIVSGHRKEWLRDLNDELNRDLRVFSRCWGRLEVAVINDDIAIRHKLASRSHAKPVDTTTPSESAS